ncbi:MAG: gluconate 2-dehydrogenase subunit 3 family protein [Kordiimonadaceae bacterium]|jgi:hypothetical protein|nr:gluconate 2-dehydrogenase subunit 3 family protein [Kordiimonadaceae bacterium]MBT6032374.1 gluconate 2-dehydrogenase subunit 3 family protein [Kordiimonadaceae bacterium]
MSEDQKKPVMTANRRRVLQLMAIAGTTAAVAGNFVDASAQIKSQGYGQDVDVNNPVVTWDKTLNGTQLKNLDVVGDLIIPADDKSPSASQLNITDFINEWVSAPYPTQEDDRKMVLIGLDWLNGQANVEDVRYFHELPADKQAAIFDKLASAVEAGTASADHSLFMERIVYLYVGGYYTTDEGMEDIGYVGNVPIESFDGPPQEVLDKLGL